MANFRMYPGRFVRSTIDQKGITAGQIYQVLHARHYLALVGVDGAFELSGKDWEPLEYVKNEDDGNRNTKTGFFNLLFGGK